MRYFLLGIAFLCSLHFTGHIQTDPEVEDEDIVAVVKSAYLFKFATSNDWPGEAKQGPFKIAIYGNDHIYREFLTKYVTKPVGSQPLECDLIEDLDDAEGYQILYIDKSKSDELDKAIDLVEDSSTLLVANGKDAMDKGAPISFVTQDSGTKYIINAKAAEKHGITFGSTIILWAVQE